MGFAAGGRSYPAAAGAGANGGAMAQLEEMVAVIAGDGETVEEWVARNRARIAESVEARGGVLLRGFRAEADETAERVLAALDLDLLDDAYWSTPRSGVSKKTFTATEYASARSISLHSEMSYMKSWPRLVAFHALVVAEEGGQTTISSVDAASAELSGILGEFASKGVIYQRTHHAGVDIPWRKAYQTDSKDEVEHIARDAGMDIKWLANDVLQTRHAAQGCVTSETGALLYFNQSNLFHPANLPQGAQAQLTQLFGADNLPRNAFFGDGSRIPAEYVQRINAAFDRGACGVSWQPGDVFIVDNMRHAHGRRPFKGARKLHVAMAARHTAPARTPIVWN